MRVLYLATFTLDTCAKYCREGNSDRQNLSLRVHLLCIFTDIWYCFALALPILLITLLLSGTLRYVCFDAQVEVFGVAPGAQLITPSGL